VSGPSGCGRDSIPGPSPAAADPDRIADFVAHETSLPVEVITGILVAIERAEPPFYFG